MANEQLLGKASAVLGERALDVVMVQHRPKSTLLALLILWAPIVLNLGLLPILMAGGVAAIVYSLLTDYRFIASTPTRLVVLKVDKLSIRGRPSAIDSDIDPADIQLADTPGINRVVFLRGKKYVMSRVFVSRLRAMLGQPA